MKSVISEYFNTKDYDSTTPEQNISSYDFIFEAGRKLLQDLGFDLTAKDEKTKLAGKILKDYADTLKALVKEEMLEEMRKRITNIETFYN